MKDRGNSKLYVFDKEKEYDTEVDNIPIELFKTYKNFFEEIEENQVEQK